MIASKKLLHCTVRRGEVRRPDIRQSSQAALLIHIQLNLFNRPEIRLAFPCPKQTMVPCLLSFGRTPPTGRTRSSARPMKHAHGPLKPISPPRAKPWRRPNAGQPMLPSHKDMENDGAKGQEAEVLLSVGNLSSGIYIYMYMCAIS